MQAKGKSDITFAKHEMEGAKSSFANAERDLVEKQRISQDHANVGEVACLLLHCFMLTANPFGIAYSGEVSKYHLPKLTWNYKYYAGKLVLWRYDGINYSWQWLCFQQLFFGDFITKIHVKMKWQCFLLCSDLSLQRNGGKLSAIGRRGIGVLF